MSYEVKSGALASQRKITDIAVGANYVFRCFSLFLVKNNNDKGKKQQKNYFFWGCQIFLFHTVSVFLRSHSGKLSESIVEIAAVVKSHLLMEMRKLQVGTFPDKALCIFEA